MKKYNVIFLLLFTLVVQGQKHKDINGDWINVKLREGILGDSIEREDMNHLLPMYISIKKNKIAFFYQAEPSDLK